MTTSAFASLMAIAVSQFTGSPSTPVEKPVAHPPILYSQPAPSQHADTRIESVPTQAIAVRPNSEPSKLPQLPVNFSTAKAADSDTLHAVELNPDQLARLGITLESDGNISICTPDRDSTAMKITIQPQLGWGAETLDPSKARTIIADPPHAVTYPDGMILAFCNGTDSRGYRNWYILPPRGSSHNFSATSVQIGGSTPNRSSIKVSVSSKPTNLSVDSVMRLGTGLTLEHRIARNLLPPPPGTTAPMQGRLRVPRLKVHSQVVDANSKIVEEQFSQIPLRTDTSAPVVAQVFAYSSVKNLVDTASLDKTIREVLLHAKGDTSRTSVRIEIRHDSGVNRVLTTKSILRVQSAVDSELSGLGTIEVQPDMIVDTTSQHEGTFVTVPIPGYVETHSEIENNKLLAQRYRQSSGDTTHFENLIPIRVTNPNAVPAHTMIFWYERTPEVMNIVPRSAVEKADARPKNLELSVYPNPTSGVTNIHYVVKNGEPVTINVVSLLGQRLIEGGSRLDQHGDLSLDLSSLEPGVYLLIATLQSGEKAVERVVVTK